MGGIEEFDYLPDQDIFVAIFTKVNILSNPKSKLLFIKPKI
jgi:phenylalanine-4-hydroxylase